MSALRVHSLHATGMVVVVDAVVAVDDVVVVVGVIVALRLAERVTAVVVGVFVVVANVVVGIVGVLIVSFLTVEKSVVVLVGLVVVVVVVVVVEVVVVVVAAAAGVIADVVAFTAIKKSIDMNATIMTTTVHLLQRIRLPFFTEARLFTRRNRVCVVYSVLVIHCNRAGGRSDWFPWPKSEAQHSVGKYRMGQKTGPFLVVGNNSCM